MMASDARSEETETALPPFSIRMSPDGRRLVKALEKRLGLRRGGVLELAVRRLAAAEGVRDERDGE